MMPENSRRARRDSPALWQRPSPQASPRPPALRSPPWPEAGACHGCRQGQATRRRRPDSSTRTPGWRADKEREATAGSKRTQGKPKPGQAVPEKARATRGRATPAQGKVSAPPAIRRNRKTVFHIYYRLRKKILLYRETQCPKRPLLDASRSTPGYGCNRFARPAPSMETRRSRSGPKEACMPEPVPKGGEQLAGACPPATAPTGTESSRACPRRAPANPCTGKSHLPSTCPRAGWRFPQEASVHRGSAPGRSLSL